MLSKAWRQRFSGIARLYGQNALALFAQSHICVVGIGGVGAWAAEALARSGIGQLTLIDLDDICISNTNRQIHALCDTIGQSKIDVMAARIKAINPECQVNAVDDFITENTLSQYISSDYDYVIDAIDSVRPKAALIAWCYRHRIPIIATGGAGGQIDPTQIYVTDLGKTIQDPLSAKVRERLKKEFGILKNGKGKFSIDCVSSTEPLRYPQPAGDVCANKNNSGTAKMDCNNGFGAVTMVTATFGFVAVAHVLKRLMYKRSVF